jgi:hypothetical protein
MVHEYYMDRLEGSGILVPDPPDLASRPVDLLSIGRPPAQGRPIPTAQVAASQNRPSVFPLLQVPGWRKPDRGRPPFQMHQNNPRGPLRGGLSIAGSWRRDHGQTGLRLRPVHPAAKGASTTDDERLLCCTLSRFCMLGCSTRKLLTTDRASSVWLPTGDHWGSVPAWSVGRWSHARISIWRR